MSLGKVYGKDEKYTMTICTNNQAINIVYME